MFTPRAHCDSDISKSWLGSRGMWVTYIICITVLHFFLISVPFLSIPLAWTLTNLIHNVCTFVVLHILKGAPWESENQGATHSLTHWEQIDDGIQWTRTRKFLIIVPIVLFFLASFYTQYDSRHFVINFVSLVIMLIPKLPQFHCVRLFGINKY